MKNCSRKVVGVDIGDRFSHVWVHDEEGEFVEKARIRTTQKGFSKYFQAKDAMLVALEAGTHSPWVIRLLQSFGHEVIVANARRVALIYGDHTKNDELDAERLARLARVDPSLLHPVNPRDEATQKDLGLVRSRAAMVEARTSLINHVRGQVKSMGHRLPKCSSKVLTKRAVKELPAELLENLSPVLSSIDRLTMDIDRYDRLIEEVSERHSITKLFRDVGGVGPVTALCYCLVVQSPDRFTTNRQVGTYLGLRPRQDKSGDTDKQLRITKAGDRYLRALLVQCAHYILGRYGPDSDLKRWGLKLAARGGKNARKRAVVAVARKLAVVLLAMWRSGEAYEPLRQASITRQAA